jgi:hypothetical protein
MGTTRERPDRRLTLLVSLVVVAAALVAGGSLWLTHAVNSGPEPVATPSPSPRDAGVTGSPATPTADDVTVYYVGQTASGPRLFAETRHLDGITGSHLEAALQAAATRPPLDRDYYPFPAGDGVAISAREGADAITVDLQRWTQPQDAGSGEEQQMALQALVWTADEAVGTTLPVRFLVDGKPADGVLSTATKLPVAPMIADDALATVSVSRPAEGEEVSSPFEVSGRAATFEANVVWELKRGRHVVRHGFATASSCCSLSPYSFSVSAPPGRYTLVVHDTDESGGEGGEGGGGIDEDTKTITVG